MIDPLVVKAPLNDRKFDYNHQELSTLQLLAKITPKLNDVINHTNITSDKVSGKEDSSNITNNRKLSPNGNFTGSILGVPVNRVLANISDNANKIGYLSNQLSDGQAGLIIDGGFFENSGIDKNFDGGVF